MAAQDKDGKNAGEKSMPSGSGEAFRQYTAFYVYVVLGLVLSTYMQRLDLWLGGQAGLDAAAAREQKARVAQYGKIGADGETLVLTPEELSKFDGTNGFPTYLGILGHVFDVSSGEFYTKQGGYHFFTACDGTRSFASGDFEGKASDDISDLTLREKGSVWGWLKFYQDHNEYIFVGLVSGRYFDEQGRPTQVYLEQKKAPEMIEQEDAETKAFEAIYPPCNSRWSKSEGGQVWCVDDMVTNRQVNRLVPRYTYVPGHKKERCSCIEYDEAVKDKKKFKPIEECNEKSQRCVTKKPRPDAVT